MTLANLSNTTYLHTLTTGMNTSHFLERLLSFIPLIQNLSVGVQDSVIIEDNMLGMIPYVTYYNQQKYR
jgi:hypothetical protein